MERSGKMFENIAQVASRMSAQAALTGGDGCMERIALALHGRDQGVDRGVKRVSKRESMSLQELRFYALLPGPDQRHGSRLSSSPGSRGVRRGRNGGSLGMGGR